MSAQSTPKRRRAEPTRPSRSRADLERLRAMSDAEVDSASPPELKDLPPDFWNDAVVVPPPKRAISLRVDQDVLDWFRARGPRYQSRMNAVLRAYMSRMQDT